MTDTVTKDTAVTTDAVTTAKPSTSTSRAKKKIDPAAEREKAVAALSFEEAIARLEGIDCRGRGTSCPDQLAKALRKALE